MERAEASTAAERAAEEQAEQAARDAQSAGESSVRRMAAATAAADEAGVDTIEAQRAELITTVPGGAVAGDGTSNCPPDYPIKGNRQSRIYHRPGQGSYTATIAELCFVSDEAAEAAGFRPSRSRGQRAQP
jgi:large subunit ribosomal protein L17